MVFCWCTCGSEVRRTSSIHRHSRQVYPVDRALPYPAKLFRGGWRVEYGPGFEKPVRSGRIGECDKPAWENRNRPRGLDRWQSIVGLGVPKTGVLATPSCSAAQRCEQNRGVRSDILSRPVLDPDQRRCSVVQHLAWQIPSTITMWIKCPNARIFGS